MQNNEALFWDPALKVQLLNVDDIPVFSFPFKKHVGCFFVKGEYKHLKEKNHFLGLLT